MSVISICRESAIGGGGKFVQAVEVLIGDNHAMSRGVGKRVEDYEVVFSAVKDQGLPVVARAQQFAKDTRWSVG
jgi:hypothetical protein